MAMLRPSLCLFGLLTSTGFQSMAPLEAAEPLNAADLAAEAAADDASDGYEEAGDDEDDGSVSTNVANDLYALEFSYPAEAAAIPELAAWLEADRDGQLAQLVEDARDIKQAAEDDGRSFSPFGLWEHWTIAGDLPRFLSISANVSVYSGGAHPSHWFDSLIWDREGGITRDPLDLFSSKEAFSAAIRAAFCDEIDKEREAKREEPVVRDPESLFSQCLDPADQTIVLTSSYGQAFDEMTILVAPYNAGPYAEGSYLAQLQITEALVEAVKPEYRRYFSVLR